MIRLGLRLTVNGGKEAAVRLVITAAAVALGVALLLTALAGMNALTAQNDRTAWLNTGSMSGPGGGRSVTDLPNPLGIQSPQTRGGRTPASPETGSTARRVGASAPETPSVPSPQGRQANTPGAPESSSPTAGVQHSGRSRPGVPSPPAGLGGAPSSASASTPGPLWWLFTLDHFGDQTINRVDVAATSPTSPVPPGISHLPGPGQFYASPALDRLLRSSPAAELADRFEGLQVGTIGASALPSPNSLIVVIGHTAQQLSQVPGAGQVARINTDARLNIATGFNSSRMRTILAVGVLALLFPVLVLIGTATRLAAARREQRFAAMRLVGATPRQVSVISAVEASFAAVGGVAVGFAVFWLLRPALTNIPFTGAPFAPGDLSLSMVDILLVAIGVPVGAVAAARFAMRRVHVSPLGVSRRVTPPTPRIYRLAPLVAGIAELLYFVGAGRPKSTGGQIDAYLSAGVLIMAGLLVAGPWLTLIGSRVMARRTGRPSVLIAGRRLSDNPRAAFRAISGLILALFATSASVGIMTTILAYHQSANGGSTANSTLLDQFGSFLGPHPQQRGHPITSTPSIPEALLTEVNAIHGVKGLAVIHSDPTVNQSGYSATLKGLVACAQLAHTPAIGRCAAGAQVANITGNLNGGQLTSKSNLAATVWPAATVSAERIQSFPVEAVVVATDGATSAIERARTTLALALPNQSPPATLGEINASTGDARLIAELQQLTNVVILVSLVIAGCSLAVSVTAGVNDRKRPFSLLRLTGVPVSVLRRVVALEAAVPLLVISVLSAGMGLVTAALFLRSQLGESLRAPGIEYYLLVIAGIVTSLAIIASTLPLIERITGPEIARNE